MKSSLISLPGHFYVGSVFSAFFLSTVTLCNADSDTDKYREELRQLKTVYENAISSGELASLEPLFTPETSGVVVDNQMFKSFAELKGIYERFRASFPGVVYKIKMDAEPSQIIGDVAITHGICDEYVKTGGGEFTYTSTWTVVLQRTDAGWKLLRSQVTMDPFRNSIVQYFLLRTKIYFGVGALGLGLVLGWILARITTAPSAPAKS